MLLQLLESERQLLIVVPSSYLVLLAVHSYGHLVLYIRLIDGRSCCVILGIVTVALCNL